MLWRLSLRTIHLDRWTVHWSHYSLGFRLENSSKCMLRRTSVWHGILQLETKPAWFLLSTRILRTYLYISRVQMEWFSLQQYNVFCLWSRYMSLQGSICNTPDISMRSSLDVSVKRLLLSSAVTLVKALDYDLINYLLFNVGNSL